MMNKQNYIYQEIKVSDLLLNPENPRFDPVRHQTETIDAMLDDQKEKLVNLAKHIMKFGLNPTDIILVKPHEKKWLVLEGSRRITAIKLLNDPELIGVKYKAIKTQFKKISKTKIGTVHCVIMSDENMANEWIRLKHTGQNEGAGIVDWNSQQTGRFNSRLQGIPDVYIRFLDALKNIEEIPDEYRKNFHKIKKTNLVRLISDPDVRKFVGVIFGEGIYTIDREINEYLLGLLYDLIFNDLSVGNIYHKADRLKYIEDLKNRIEKSGKKHQPKSSRPGNAQGGNTTHASGGNAGTSTNQFPNASRTVKHGNGYPINRKTLIPLQHCLSITNARILKIFNELKYIDIFEFPNSVAVLFRVFIELSCDCYIGTNFMRNVTLDSKLGQKIEAVASDLETKSVMTKNELRTARQMSSSPTQNNSIKTFHAYVHNKDVTPLAKDLQSAWDDLWPFIEKIWL
jgi:hypothetical protein